MPIKLINLLFIVPVMQFYHPPPPVTYRQQSVPALRRIRQKVEKNFKNTKKYRYVKKMVYICIVIVKLKRPSKQYRKVLWMRV